MSDALLGLMCAAAVFGPGMGHGITVLVHRRRETRRRWVYEDADDAAYWAQVREWWNEPAG